MNKLIDTPELMIDERLLFTSMLDYILLRYNKIVLFGDLSRVKGFLQVSTPYHRSIIAYIVSERSDEKTVLNIPVKGIDAKPDGIDLVVVCADRNEKEYINKARLWGGSSIGIFALGRDSVMLGAIREGESLPKDDWPTRMYIICTLQRTGSTMLVSMLRRTKVLGIPGERFTTLLKRNVDKKIISYDEILPEVFKRYQTSNGILGLKIHGYQYPIFEEAIDSIRGKDKEIIDNLTKNASYIFLARQNLYEQSVSLWRARQTGTFHILNTATSSNLNAVLKRISIRKIVNITMRVLMREKNSLPPYDYEEIRKTLVELIEERGFWLSFFRENNINPLLLKYESIIHDTPRTIAEIASYLCVDIPEDKTLIKPATKKMADGYTQEIVEKFKSDLRGLHPQLSERIEHLMQASTQELQI